MDVDVTADNPFALDVDFYRNRYPDLAHMTGDEARDHFVRHGAGEGRQAVAVGCRPAFIERLKGFGSILEIGPFCNPVVRGANVRYLDVLDAAGLRARAAEIGLDVGDCPEAIHHVGHIDDVTATFDAVVSSHSIEHQPDLVRHFEGVARILRPGGEYHLLVPDKRYCFDHFIPESTVADVIQAHEDKRMAHSLRSVIEHRALTTHNDPGAHWQGTHGERHPSNQPDRIRAAIDEYRSADGYVDVHAWYFTPTNFWNITHALYVCGLTRLKPVEIHPTLHGTLEFLAVLRFD